MGAKVARKRKQQAKVERHPATDGLPDTYVWDEARDGPKPDSWRRSPPAVPCKRCGARQNKHASQAVVCYGIKKVSGDDTAYLHCRVCFSKFTLPVSE